MVMPQSEIQPRRRHSSSDRYTKINKVGEAPTGDANSRPNCDESARKRGSSQSLGPSPPPLDYSAGHISQSSSSSHLTPNITTPSVYTTPVCHPRAGSNLYRETDEDHCSRHPAKRRRLLTSCCIENIEVEAETLLHLRSGQPSNQHTSVGWDPVWKPGSSPQPDSQDRRGNVDLVEYWAREGRWPPNRTPQEMEDQARTIGSSAQGPLLKQKVPLTRSGRKRSRSDSDDGSASDSTDAKSARYRSAAYEIVLETKDVLLRDDDGWADAASAEAGRALVRTLLHIATNPSEAPTFSHPTPQMTLFADPVFEKTCRKVSAKNEARVVRDILPLIVPSAEILAIWGATHLNNLVESINQSWDCAQPLVAPRPQPDYSVGFARDAFTQAQLARLGPHTGDGTRSDSESPFMGTRLMYFPFLTCEVKCGDQALAIADRQNAHSMTLAVRGVVELFRLVGRERELSHRILALSISHDDSNVRIYGHYPVVQAAAPVKYYRHKIHAYDFTVLDGRDKWTAYRIVRYIYDRWMPSHLEIICSAIDGLNVPTPVPFLNQQSNIWASEADGAALTLDEEEHRRSPAS